MSVRLLLVLRACLLLITIKQIWALQLTRRISRENYAILPRPTILYSTRGANVTLTCHVEDTYNSIQPWFYVFVRNGWRLPGTYFVGRYELSMTSPSNDGMYRCLTSARNFESQMSHAFKLVVSSLAILPGPINILHNRNGTHRLLTCYVENLSAYNDPWFFWYKNNRRIDFFHHVYVLSMTSHDEGNYSCQIMDKDGWGTGRSDPFEVVMSEFEATPPRPTISHRRRGSEHIVLTCHIENHQAFSQPWSYLWWKNDEHIASLFILESYELSMTSQDAGNYSCEMDAGGVRSPRSNIFVMSLPEPAIPPRPSLSNSTNGTHVILTCHVENRSAFSQPWTYFWWKNDALINASLFNDDSDQLSMTSHDEGNYSCVMRAGDTRSPRSNTLVFVTPSPEVTPPRPTILHSVDGINHIVLTCHVENHQELRQPWSYIWWKNDEYITSLPHDIYTFPKESEDEGNYSCEMVAGGARSTRSNTFVFDMSAPEVTPPRPTILHYRRGSELIVLTCDVENYQAFSQPWSFHWWKNDEYIGALNHDTYAFSMTSQYEGDYSCEMVAGGARSTRSNTFVFDMSAPEITPPRPTILDSTASSDYLVLVCHVENYWELRQPWSYLWWKNDEYFGSLVDEEVIYISMTSQVEGNYSCEMDAGGARSTRSNTFVFDMSPPGT